MFPDPSHVQPDESNSEVNPTLVSGKDSYSGDDIPGAGADGADTGAAEGEQIATAFSAVADDDTVEEVGSGVRRDCAAVAVSEQAASDKLAQRALPSNTLPRPKRRDLQVIDPKTGHTKLVGWQGVPVSSKSVSGSGPGGDKNKHGRAQRKRKQRPRCATELVAEGEAEAEATKAATKQATESRRASLKVFGIAQAAYRSYRQSDLSAKRMWRCLLQQR